MVIYFIKINNLHSQLSVLVNLEDITASPNHKDLGHILPDYQAYYSLNLDAENDCWHLSVYLLVLSTRSEQPRDTRIGCQLCPVWRGDMPEKLYIWRLIPEHSNFAQVLVDRRDMTGMIPTYPTPSTETRSPLWKPRLMTLRAILCERVCES